MMDKKETAILMLKQKADMLGRLPKKDDFDEISVSKIKGILGPWPRALESAGLKQPKNKTCAKRKSKK
ncbi:MAG: hypothetical protein K2F81_08565 [Ruminococcus sp.]|nr:hypothetical protein [Ruminococcus sp.]